MLVSTYPTAMAAGYVDTISEMFTTTIDGSVFCTSRLNTDVPFSVFTIIEPTPAQLPTDYESTLLSYYSLWGIKTPLLCNVGLAGIPSENIPVVTLTETRTISPQELSAIPTSSKASISQPLPSVSASQENPRTTFSSPTAKPTRLAFPITQSPYTSSQQKAASPGPASHASNNPPSGNELQPVMSTGQDAPGNLPTAGTAGSPVWDSQNSKTFGNPQSNNGPSELPDSEIVNNGGHDATSESPNDMITVEGAAGSNTRLGYATRPQTQIQSADVQFPGTSEPLGGVRESAIIQTTGPQFLSDSVQRSLTVAGEVATSDRTSQYVFGSHTLTAGAPGITIDGTLISLQSLATALVIGSSTTPIVKATNPEAITVNGLALNRGPSSDLFIGTREITPGAPVITISGTLISLDDSGTAVFIDGSSFPVATPTSQSVVTDTKGYVFTKAPGSGLLVGSQTLVPGGPAININNTLMSLVPAATAVVIGGSTIPVPNLASQPTVLNIDGHTFTDVSGSTFVVGSQTLVPGGPAITVNGTLMSLAPAATDVVIGGSTFPVSVATGKPLEIDVNDYSIAKASGSDFIVGSQTLVPGGPAITVNGTLVSLAPSATDLVIGTQTEALTTSQKMGEIILGGFFSGIPGAPTATNGSNVVNLGGRSFEQCIGWTVGVVILICFVSSTI